MAAHEVGPARAKRDRQTIPPRNNSVRARRSRRPKTRASSLLVWVSMLAAAVVLAAGGYWGYRQMQPRPLFTPASASAEQVTVPAAPPGDGSGRGD